MTKGYFHSLIGNLCVIGELKHQKHMTELAAQESITRSISKGVSLHSAPWRFAAPISS